MQFTIPSGDINVFFDITIMDDNVVENTESFALEVTTFQVGVTIGTPSRTTVEITDNDGK